jgi:CRISPR-associated endoribonuclease Cas6
MTFDFYSFRFVFSALDAIVFPPGQPGNILRGAFGMAFRGIVCPPDCPGARHCPTRESCDYARIFEPASLLGSGPSGFRDRPRPFVFRAAYLDGRRVQPEERFWFDVNLFETRNPPLEPFALAFERLFKEGLGPERGRANLVSVEQRPISIPLDANSAETRTLRVEFVTPTELKSGDQLVTRPDFDVLFARARDRVGTLRALYGPGPLEIDFRAMGERAAAIRMTRCELRQVEAERRSSRTGQVHGIGGFVGVAEYEGALSEFIPYLDAAQWTGIGRQCVWGKGELRVSVGQAAALPIGQGGGLSY